MRMLKVNQLFNILIRRAILEILNFVLVLNYLFEVAACVVFFVAFLKLAVVLVYILKRNYFIHISILI